MLFGKKYNFEIKAINLEKEDYTNFKILYNAGRIYIHYSCTGGGKLTYRVDVHCPDRTVEKKGPYEMNADGSGYWFYYGNDDKKLKEGVYKFQFLVNSNNLLLAEQSVTVYWRDDYKLELFGFSDNENNTSLNKEIIVPKRIYAHYRVIGKRNVDVKFVVDKPDGTNYSYVCKNIKPGNNSWYSYGYTDNTNLAVGKYTLHAFIHNTEVYTYDFQIINQQTWMFKVLGLSDDENDLTMHTQLTNAHRYYFHYKIIGKVNGLSHTDVKFVFTDADGSKKEHISKDIDVDEEQWFSHGYDSEDRYLEPGNYSVRAYIQNKEAAKLDFKIIKEPKLEFKLIGLSDSDKDVTIHHELINLHKMYIHYQVVGEQAAKVKFVIEKPNGEVNEYETKNEIKPNDTTWYSFGFDKDYLQEGKYIIHAFIKDKEADKFELNVVRKLDEADLKDTTFELVGLSDSDKDATIHHELVNLHKMYIHYQIKGDQSAKVKFVIDKPDGKVNEYETKNEIKPNDTTWYSFGFDDDYLQEGKYVIHAFIKDKEAAKFELNVVRKLDEADLKDMTFELVGISGSEDDATVHSELSAIHKIYIHYQIKGNQSAKVKFVIIKPNGNINEYVTSEIEPNSTTWYSYGFDKSYLEPGKYTIHASIQDQEVGKYELTITGDSKTTTKQETSFELLGLSGSKEDVSVHHDLFNTQRIFIHYQLTGDRPTDVKILIYEPDGNINKHISEDVEPNKTTWYSYGYSDGKTCLEAGKYTIQIFVKNKEVGQYDLQILDHPDQVINEDWKFEMIGLSESEEDISIHNEFTNIERFYYHYRFHGKGSTDVKFILDLPDGTTNEYVSKDRDVDDDNWYSYSSGKKNVSLEAGKYTIHAYIGSNEVNRYDFVIYKDLNWKFDLTGISGSENDISFSDALIDINRIYVHYRVLGKGNTDVKFVINKPDGSVNEYVSKARDANEDNWYSYGNSDVNKYLAEGTYTLHVYIDNQEMASREIKVARDHGSLEYAFINDSKESMVDCHGKMTAVSNIYVHFKCNVKRATNIDIIKYLPDGTSTYSYGKVEPNDDDQWYKYGFSKEDQLLEAGTYKFEIYNKDDNYLLGACSVELTEKKWEFNHIVISNQPKVYSNTGNHFKGVKKIYISFDLEGSLNDKKNLSFRIVNPEGSQKTVTVGDVTGGKYNYSLINSDKRIQAGTYQVFLCLEGKDVESTTFEVEQLQTGIVILSSSANAVSESNEVKFDSPSNIYLVYSLINANLPSNTITIKATLPSGELMEYTEENVTDHENKLIYRIGYESKNRALAEGIYTFNFYLNDQSEPLATKQIEVTNESSTMSSTYNKGDIIELGSYKQGLQGEVAPIQWEVIKADDKNVLLISKNILDAKPFNSDLTETNWKDSTLRTWLNDDFYNDAFTKKEKEILTKQKVITKTNPGKEEGEELVTEEMVTLLSLHEAMEYFIEGEVPVAKRGTMTFYRFGENGVADGSAYTHTTNLSFPRNTQRAGWWTRTTGYTNKLAVIFNYDGNVNIQGNNVSFQGAGIRPCISLEIEQISMDGNSPLVNPFDVFSNTK